MSNQTEREKIETEYATVLKHTISDALFTFESELRTLEVMVKAKEAADFYGKKSQ